MREDQIITRQGKRMALYPGLLDEAHKKGLRGIDTELVQVPTEENGNVAICKAVVEVEQRRYWQPEEETRPELLGTVTSTFSGIGDASPDNVGRNIAPHIIRMAETRAKARALRDAVNVAEAVDPTEHEEEEPAAQAPAKQRRNAELSVVEGPKASEEQIFELARLIDVTDHDRDAFEERFGPLPEISAALAEHWTARLKVEEEKMCGA